MPLFSEDVIIRILADSSSGIREMKKTNAELKKMGGQAKTSAKDLLKIGASFGGITAAIDLGVKAITAYIQKIKESEQAYIEAAKTQNIAISEGIEAYNRLEAAKEQQMIIDGKLHTEYMAGHRERRAARIEETTLVKEMTAAQYEQWRTENEGMTRGNEEFQSRTDFMREYNDQIDDVSESYAAASQSASNYMNVVAEAEAWLKGIEDARLEARNKWLTAEALAERQIDAMELKTALLNATDLEAIELNREHQIELIKLNQYYKEHQDELIAATDAYYDAQLAIASLSGEMTKLKNKKPLDAMFGDAATNDYLTNLNALGGAMSSFIGEAFGDTKGAAIAQALINQALAITNIWAQFGAYPPLAAGLTGIAVAATGFQIANINKQSYATGTPPGGYIVPEGYGDDSYPVQAKSGERVIVEPVGGGSTGGDMAGDVYLDSTKVGRWINRATDRNVIRPNARSLVASR